MRYFKLHFIFTLIMLLTCGSVQASVDGPVQASDGSTVYMPTTDGVCKVYQVEGTVTFKAVESGEMSNYKDFGVAFLPANTGDHIMITVNSIDISGGTRLIMYDGDVDYSKIGQSGAGGSSPFTYFPAGWVKEIVKGTDEGYSFTSTQDNGIVAFGCTTRSGTRNGWDITVTSLSAKDMEYVSSGAITDLPGVNRGAKSQNIFGVDIVTDGGANALTLNALSIDCSALTGSTAVSNVRLVKGTDVLATATTVGDALSASDITLKSGHNTLMVVADIDPDAAGTIPALTVTNITIDGVARTVSPTAGNDITVNNVIIMASDGVTYTIDDNVAAFYDDGGKDANYTRNFSGQVTFVPATAGYSIKVDFTKLALFDASLDSNDDVLKFYNGREVNEANLITTLLTEPEIVKSTAADGSMTVTFKTVTGYPTDGWEATVSQFLPGDMTLSGITAEVAETATVSAGDTDVQMLVVDVMTDNQSNPLTVNTINLTTPDAKNIATARAYYLGKKSDFATTNLWAETAVTTTGITLSGNQPLAEGHNFFAIVLDLNEEGIGGEQVSLSVQDVVVGQTTQAPAQAVTATRTINNICHATRGSHSHTIKDAWTFTHTEGYSGKYEAEDADYIVTFTPAEAGTVAEIDFSSFNVTYSSSSYGVKAVFEIYSGTTVDNTQLLWQLKDNSEASVGPGKVLRSTSADGSLTIRFNPKTTSSYNAGTGWMATVRPFLNHEMTINEVKVNQTDTDDVAVGTTDAALIDFEVVTEGTLSTIVLTEVGLNLKDSYSNLSKVNVYYNNVDNRDEAVLFGSIDNPNQSALAVIGERELAEGSNYFWVTADIKADAAADAIIDAALLTLRDNANTETTVDNGDPEGSRTVKYLYVMQTGKNIVTVTDPMLFYDDGGKDGKISSRFSGTVTFVPGRDNSAVQMNANSFSIGNGRMTVYSGSEVDETKIIGPTVGYYSTTGGPTDLISKADDGSLTVVVSGPSGTTLDGWEIEVSLHEKVPFQIETADAVATADDIMRNAVDGRMQHLTVEVSGDKNPIAINSITIDATGTTDVADITAAKVYYTAKTTSFDNDNLVGSLSTIAAGENTITFDEPLIISDNGTYNLWLTYDIAEEATAGNTVAAQFVSLAYGEETMAIAGNAAQRTIKAGMKGNYIIGSSDLASYATFAEATTALAGGVEGPVTFQVEDGTYNEAITIANVPGAGQKAPIVFVSLTGNRDNVVVKGLSGASSGNMVTIENTPWVSFEAISFVPASQSYKNAIYVYNRSSHFTLKDSYIKAETITSGYSGINLLRSETMSGEDNSNNDYMTIEDNTFEGGYISVYLNGSSAVYFRDDRGHVIKDNVIANPRSKAIYVLDSEGAMIEGNLINQSTTTATSYSAIDVYRNTGAFVVKNNVIVNSHSAYSNGIYLRQECEGESANSPALVYNNSIIISNSPTNSTAGIQVNSDTRNVALYYNTVRVAGTAGYCYYNGGNSTRYNNVKLQNNLFQNLTTNGYVALFYDQDKVAATEMLNNVFYAATEGNLIKDYATTLETLNTLVGNESNKEEQAEFLSDIDNHLMSIGTLNMALPVDFITTDVDGSARDAETPTVGAYEYEEVVDETPELAEGYPIVANVTETSAIIKSKWNVSGKLYTLVEAVSENEGGNGAPAKAPTADDLQANGTAVDYTADTEATTTFSNLEPSTSYKAYMMLVSVLNVPGEIVEANFTTERHIDPLTATLAKNYATIEAGESVTLIPTVAGGDEPYTYLWTDQAGNEVGTDATLTVTPETTYGYRLAVTSADGQSATAKTGVYVLGESAVATFDDNYLAPESFFNGDNDDDEFYSGSYAFEVGNAIWPGSTVSFWYGYALSDQTATTYAGLDDQYHGITGSGRNNSANYVIAYPSGTDIRVTHSEDGDTIKGMYVSPTAYSYASMATGDGYARAFVQGDYLKMIITGTDANNQTSSIDFYLGDYRSANEADRYILSDWEWVDLRPLGKVTRLSFAFDGSDTNEWGLKTATYFALDDFGADREITDMNYTVPTGASDIELASLFAPVADGATVEYSIEVPADNEYINVTLDGAVLHVTAEKPAAAAMRRADADNTLRVIVCATRRGHKQYVGLNLSVEDVTAVTDLAANRTVQSVKYVDASGRVSDRPFDGVNMVVTRYTDGTVSTVKQRR